MNISIIVPVYNEGEGIQAVIHELQNFLKTLSGHVFEIVVVNDGSTDKTGDKLRELQEVKVITHKSNKGYGAALKTGIKNSQYDWVMFYDSDGQAKPQEISKLIEHTKDYDMVVGARIHKKAPLIRDPGRRLLHFLANYLADHKIPDINSGFRMIKRAKIQQFWHLLPNSFSLTTTITLAFQKSDLDIKYVPIEINKRDGGRSTVKPRHAIRMFFLILRTITLFSPLRVFMPVVFSLWVLLALSLGYDIYHIHITNTTVILFIASLVIFFFGLLADQMSAIRREIGKQS